MSITGQIHKAHTVDFSKFKFAEVTVNKYGGKSSKVKYEGRDFYIQTPRMRLPYGISVYEEKDNDGKVTKQKFSLDMSFAGYDKEPEMDSEGKTKRNKVKDFFDFSEKMQDLLVTQAIASSVAWLDMAEASEGVAKALTRDLVRYPRDKITKQITNRYPPTIKSKLGFWDNKFIVNAFDENKEKIEDLRDALVPRTEVVAILKLQQVNFAGGKCGYSFLVNQMKVYQPEGMPSYAFDLDSDDEKPVNAGSNEVEENANDAESTTEDNLVEDTSEDEELDELDEEEEESPPPPKPTKKKGGRKKKGSK
jgi:hypothetical protein